MGYIIQTIGAFFATSCFSVVFNVSKKNIITCGLIGASGWLIYVLTIYMDGSIVLGNFVASLWIALTSHIMARIKKTPVTHFFIPGILTFVPGGGMFRAVYNVIENNNNIAIFYLVQSLEIAGVIALAIFIIDSLFRLIKKSPTKEYLKIKKLH